MVGVEIAEDERIVPDLREPIELRPETRGAARGRWDVDVIDVDIYAIDGGGDTLVFGDCIGCEEEVCGEGLVRDGVMNQGEEASTSGGARSIFPNHRVVRKVWESRGWAKLGLLDASNQDTLVMEERLKFIVGCADAVAVELED